MKFKFLTPDGWIPTTPFKEFDKELQEKLKKTKIGEACATNSPSGGTWFWKRIK